ncbi:unnamed protein product [Linum trigynum]|uniref:Coilin tudor domain-containing protein n=1 Tax=Linum trigynum TaxID=586398 RepID=A0AAV2CTQ0_9ROSI
MIMEIPVINLLKDGRITQIPATNPETWNHYANSGQKPSETQPVEEPTSVYNQIDFDKLAAYMNSPKERDVIAYRLIQLSSSWTPELSPYLVGKISKFDPQTNKIKLVAVPKYPLIPENKLDDEESEVLPETCSLQEDGSLEMDFTSLLEVHAVNPSSAGEATKSPWNEISEALNAKKAELSHEDNNWTVTESSGTNQWSFKALRGKEVKVTQQQDKHRNKLITKILHQRWLPRRQSAESPKLQSSEWRLLLPNTPSCCGSVRARPTSHPPSTSSTLRSPTGGTRPTPRRTSMTRSFTAPTMAGCSCRKRTCSSSSIPPPETPSTCPAVAGSATG